MSRRFLFLCLGKRTWGEALLGLHIARDLADAGAACAFLADRAVAPLLRGGPFEWDEVLAGNGWYLRHQIGRFLSRPGAWTLVLCDYHTTTCYLLDEGLEADALLDLGVPVVPLDTWDHQETGFEIDFCGGSTRKIPRWLERVPFRITPVPIAKSGKKEGAYANLPPAVRTPPSIRAEVRRQLGLHEGDKLVLWCTSAWQHAPFPSPAAGRLGDAAPHRVAAHLAALGKNVHLAHVGPAEFLIHDLLGGRYHALPQLPRAEFELVLGSADLLLSLNFSATTATRAIVSHIPVLTFINSLSGEDAQGIVQRAYGACSPALSNWLRMAGPLHPFLLWPFGWHRFLSPLLRDNPYVDAMRVVELLDEHGAAIALHDLLFSGGQIDALRKKQSDFVQRTAELPSASRLLLNLPGY